MKQEQIMATFSHVPPDVFRQCVEPVIEIIKRAFITDSFRVFGNLSAYEFSQLRWYRVDIVMNKSILCPFSYKDICAVIDNAHGIATHIGDKIQDSRDRFLSQLKHLQGTHPPRMMAPVVLYRAKDNTLRLCDGAHRLAAWFHLNLHNSRHQVDAWVGEFTEKEFERGA